MAKHHLKKHDAQFDHVHLKEDGLHNERTTESAKAFARDVEEGLQVIYGDDTQDLHVVEKDQHHATRVLVKIVLALALCTGLAYIAFFAYTTFFREQVQEPLHITITAPTQVQSGSEITIEVAYGNPQNIPLAQLSIDLNLPSGFVVTSSLPDPSNAEELVWTIGSLGQHSDGKIIFTGYWFAEVPSIGIVQAVSTYRPANFNADFSTITTASLSADSSLLQSSLTGPAAVAPGEEATYVFSLTNTATRTLEHIATEFLLPSTFIVTSFEPALEPGGAKVWTLASLEAGQSTSMTLRGAYAGDAKDVQQLDVRTTLIPAEGRSAVVQATTSWFTDVQGGDVRLSLAANGSTSQALVAPGEQLRVSAQVVNEGEKALSDLVLTLDFQPEQGIPISWSESTLGGAQITAAGIVLSAQKIGTLAPGERKTFSFLFPLKAEVTSTNVTDFAVTAYVTSAQGKVQSTPIAVQVNAAVALDAQARYYDAQGAPVGAGVFPPEVDQETTFLLTWKIDKQLHALEDVSIAATLPPDVTFVRADTATAGTLSYDEATRTVRWTVDVMHEDEQTLTQGFFLTLIPGDEDVDTYVKLLSSSILRATDSVTGATLADEDAALTTELPDDVTAAGKGIIAD